MTNLYLIFFCEHCKRVHVWHSTPLTKMLLQVTDEYFVECTLQTLPYAAGLIFSTEFERIENISDNVMSIGQFIASEVL